MIYFKLAAITALIYIISVIILFIKMYRGEIMFILKNHKYFINRPTEFGDVYDFLGKIPNLNSGGCLVSAYSVYLWCKNNGILEPKFRLVGFTQDDELESNKNHKYLNGISKDADSDIHFGWASKLNIFFDSKGIINESRYKNYYEIHQDKIDDFFKSAYYNGNWNTMYNTNYNKIIQYVLKIKL